MIEGFYLSFCRAQFNQSSFTHFLVDFKKNVPFQIERNLQTGEIKDKMQTNLKLQNFALSQQAGFRLSLGKYATDS